MQFFAFFGFIFVVLQYLQLVRGDSPLISAVSMLPMAAVMIPSARISPRLTEKFGSRPVCVVGLVLVSAGLLMLSQLDVDSSYWLLLAGLIPLGIGMGTAMTPATSAITGALPMAQQGVASAMNDLSREVGGALGIAVLGSVLTQGTAAISNCPASPRTCWRRRKSRLRVPHMPAVRSPPMPTSHSRAACSLRSWSHPSRCWPRRLSSVC